MSGSIRRTAYKLADSLPEDDLLSQDLLRRMERPTGLRMLANPSPVLFRLIRGGHSARFLNGSVILTHSYLISLERKARGKAPRRNFHE